MRTGKAQRWVRFAHSGEGEWVKRPPPQSCLTLGLTSDLDSYLCDLEKRHFNFESPFPPREMEINPFPVHSLDDCRRLAVNTLSTAPGSG